MRKNYENLNPWRVKTNLHNQWITGEIKKIQTSEMTKKESYLIAPRQGEFLFTAWPSFPK